MLFIIDLWLWALLGFATWFSLRREKRGGEWMRPARIAGAVGLAYIGVNAGLTYRAEQLVRPDPDTSPKALIIANPVPFASWKRDLLAGVPKEWWVGSGTPFIRLFGTVPCAWPDTDTLRRSDADLDAFLFWARAPFAERAPDGSVLLRDARFYDPRARDRFSVALPDVQCEPLTKTVRPELVEGPHFTLSAALEENSGASTSSARTGD